MDQLVCVLREIKEDSVSHIRNLNPKVGLKSVDTECSLGHDAGVTTRGTGISGTL